MSPGLKTGRSAAGALLAVAALAVCTSACSSNTNGTTTPAGGDASSERTNLSTNKGGAPDFTLPSLDGRNVSLSDFLGKKVILIDFWATTCQPCLVEMPHVVALYEKYKDRGFVVIAVAGDGPETSAQVPAAVHSKSMTFPVLLDEETSVIARYSPKKDMPFWVLIDKQGNVVTKKNGYDPGDEKTLAAEIEKLLQ